MLRHPFQAVLFDLGGVVFTSPFEAIYSYEKDLGLRKNSINKVIVKNGHNGAFSSLEKGIYTLSQFYIEFDKGNLPDTNRPSPPKEGCEVRFQ